MFPCCQDFIFPFVTKDLGAGGDTLTYKYAVPNKILACKLQHLLMILA